MNQNKDDSELKQLLKDMSYNDDEVHRIVGRLRRYEKEMRIDSIMDSIGQPGFDLDALIQEALAESND